jgi:catechol 2,3-dioxygenase-like lactoylglutathione lyase family enzyme
VSARLQKASLDAGIVTRDIDAASRFYGGVLGLPLAGEIAIPGVGTIRRYAVGDSTLRLYRPEQLPAQADAGGDFAACTGIRYLTLYVANIEEVLSAVDAAGFRVSVPLRDLRPGVRVAQVLDADGNAVELMHQAS